MVKLDEEIGGLRLTDHSNSSDEDMSTFLKVLKHDKNTQRILIMLVINFSFTFVELIYGFMANSLSLISDSAHMLFDSSALAIGLYASYMSKKKPNMVYTFGYDRFQVLSGFINGIFLIFVGFYIFIESMERILEPQIVYSEKMFWVAIIGLAINLVGLLLFHDHAHMNGPCSHSHNAESHEAAHEHKHEKCSGDHHIHDKKEEKVEHKHHNHKENDHSSHSDHKHEHKHEHKHKEKFDDGVFLHILADTLGSVAVILSYFVIQQWKFYIIDPISSFVVSLLIFASVYPLIKQSVAVLMIDNDSKAISLYQNLEKSITELECVSELVIMRIWPHLMNELHVNLILKSVKGISEKKVKKEVKKLIKKRKTIKSITLEIQS